MSGEPLTPTLVSTDGGETWHSVEPPSKLPFKTKVAIVLVSAVVVAFVGTIIVRAHQAQARDKRELAEARRHYEQRMAELREVLQREFGRTEALREAWRNRKP